MARVRPQAIVALDAPALAGAWAIVERLGEDCDFYKVGSELFTAEGPRVVRRLGGAGKAVFLDLKYHDIPATVRGAVRSAAATGARLISVHASGGRAMLEAAVEGAGERCGVLAVTVLTSLDARALADSWGRDDIEIAAEVLRLADLARSAGVHGVVCGGPEAARVRARHGETLEVLVPGIRLAGSAVGDQARVVTPGDAARAGAGYVVLGRTVTASPDAREAMRRVATELAAAV